MLVRSQHTASQAFALVVYSLPAFSLFFILPSLSKTSKTNIDDLFLCTNVLPKSDGCMLSAAAARDATIALLCGQPIPELPPGAATKRCKKKYCIAWSDERESVAEGRRREE